MDQTVLLCTLVAFLLYYNTLSADFAYDDSRAIKTNPDVQPATPWTNLLFNDFWGTPLTHTGSHKSYRPLCVLSFRLNYWLHELQPFGYHLVNVILHAIATALFVCLARSLFNGSRFATSVAGLTFAAHPVHTEAVAGIVGRADIGAAIFFLLAFLSYRRYVQLRTVLIHASGSHPKLKSNPSSSCVAAATGSASCGYGRVLCEFFWSQGNTTWPPSKCWLTLRKWVWLATTVLCAACSMLTKEHGITVLAVCALFDVLVHCRIKPKDVLWTLIQRKHRGLVEGLVTLFLSAGVLIAIRLLLMGSRPPEFAPADNPAADCTSMLTRFLTFAYLPAFNFWLLLHPAVLSFDWSMEAIALVTSASDVRNVASVLLYGCLAQAAWKVTRRMQRRRTDFYPGTLISSPASSNGHSHNYPSSSSTALPSGGSAQLTSAEHQVMDCSGKYDSLDLTVIGMSMLVLPFVPATNLLFYVGFVVAERVLYIPSIGFCLLLGFALHFVHEKKLKKKRHRRLLRLALVAFFALYCTRTVLRNQDWLTEESLYRSGISVNPPKAYGNLANILSSTGRKEEAEWAYKKALSYRHNMADVHYNLGILYQEQRRYEEAIQSYKLAIHYRPRMAMAHLNMGLVLALLGQKEEAIEVYRRCSQLDGSGLKDPRTHEATKISALFNLGRLYADDAQYLKAIEVYHEAIQRMPSHYQPQSLYNMLGEAYFKLDRFKEAEHWYREALRVKADHVPAHLTYGKLLTRMNRLAEAEELFLRAKTLAPNDSTVYQHYGQFLSECERHAEAAEQYIKAASLAPAEYEIIFNAANTLRQAGRHIEAERYYRTAVKLRPTEATSHMNLGAMLHVNGKLIEAEQSYLEALRLKPDDHITRTNLQKLRHLLLKKGISSKGGTG